MRYYITQVVSIVRVWFCSDTDFHYMKAMVEVNHSLILLLLTKIERKLWIITKRHYKTQSVIKTLIPRDVSVTS